MPGGARRDLMVRISLLARKFKGENQKKKKKKGLQRKILGSVLAFSSAFRPETKFHSRLGGTASFLGKHRLQNALQWHPACYFLSRQNPRLGGTIIAWVDTSSDVYSSDMPPIPHGAEPA